MWLFWASTVDAMSYSQYLEAFNFNLLFYTRELASPA